MEVGLTRQDRVFAPHRFVTEQDLELREICSSQSEGQRQPPGGSLESHMERGQQDQGKQGSDLRQILPGARGAILDWFNETGVSPSRIWAELLAREGISVGIDVYQEIFRRYGEDVFNVTLTAWREYEESLDALLRADSMPDFLKGEALIPKSQREIRSLLLAVPDGLFLNAVPAGYAVLSDDWGEHLEAAPNPSQHFNRIFEKRNVPYRFNANLGASWHGDQAAHEEIVEPALAVLADQRLGVARADFDEALAQLRIGTAKARKDAVNHGAKAVEGVLSAVLQDRGLPLPDRMQAQKLWQRLCDEGVVSKDSEAFLSGATRLRNKRGSHSNEEEVSGAEAEASVMSAAVAVRFFASFLA
jgi:hypothetical protein